MKRALVTAEQQFALDKALLYKCANRASLSQIALLLEKGANPNATTDASGYTALMWLCYNHKGVVLSVKLLIAARANVQASLTYDKQMAIHMAVAVGDVPTVEALLDAGSPI
jgi:ankyrin repeat protein